MELLKFPRESVFSNKVKECLLASDLSEGSIRQYWRAFALWIECFSHKKKMPPTEEDLKVFAKFLYDRYKYSSNKFHLTIYSILSIFIRYSSYYNVPFNSKNARDIMVILVESYRKSGKGNKSQTVEPISDKDLNTLLEYVKSISNRRMELFLHMLIETGFRRYDLTNLKISNLTFKDNNTVIIKTTIKKTSRPIEIVVNDIYTIELLNKWIETNNLIDNDFIFYSIRLGVHCKTSPWTRQALYQQLNTYLKRCNITTHITLVSFRKKLAQSLYNEGIHFQKIKERLGWNSDGAKFYITEGFWNHDPEVNDIISFNNSIKGKVPHYLKVKTTTLC